MRLSMTAVSLGLVLGAVVCYVAFVLYGAWIDGKREDVRRSGGHPTTGERGDVRDADDDE